MLRSGGWLAWQRASANGQRGAKRQPAGWLAGLGTLPSMVDRRSRTHVQPRDRAQQADGVRMLRVVEQRLHRRALDDLAGIHHDHLVDQFGNHAQVVRDDQHGHAQALLQIAQQIEDLRLDRHIQGGGGLVGHQQHRLAGQGHGDHHPLAHAARQPVRKVVEPLRRRRDAHQLQHLDGPLLRVVVGHAGVGTQRLDDLRADGVHRVQAGHRLLEHHGHAAAAQQAPLLGRHGHHVAALEQQRIGLHLTGRLRHQAHQRQRGDALAAARFTHQPHGAATPHLEADAVDGLEQAALGVEPGAQVAHVEQRGVVLGRPASGCGGAHQNEVSRPL